MGSMRVVAAPDKFKGTATATDIAAAIASATRDADQKCDEVPMADGGEGTVAALGGSNRSTLVRGPLGDPVAAAWRFHQRRAVIEMAAASGLVVAGGAESNDAIAASTAGTGELLAAALEAGADRVVLGVGGSASTDGGLGAIRAMEPMGRFRRMPIDVACDVRTRFQDAARVFGPQKGAGRAEIELLSRRLDRLVQLYEEDYGVDVSELVGGGAAGGLAGGLAAVGARLVSGVDLIAEEVGLADAIEGADLVVTGEGLLDAESFEGKVVGGVIELAEREGVPVLVIAGDVDLTGPLPEGVTAISLVDEFGADDALADPLRFVAEIIAGVVADQVANGPMS